MTVTETVGKAKRSLRWEIETVEVESGSHRGQTILLIPFSTYYFDKTAYYRYSAISGTTTDTSLSLAITEPPYTKPQRRRLTSKISSHLKRLHYGKMAAVP